MILLDLTVKEQSERILEDQVIAVLECAREILKAGVPDYNIPSFDPLYAEEVAVDLDSLGVNGLRYKKKTF